MLSLRQFFVLKIQMKLNSENTHNLDKIKQTLEENIPLAAF